MYSVPWINRAVRYDIASFYSGSKPVHSADFLGYTVEFEIYEQGNTLAPRDKFQIIDEHRIKEKFNVLNCYENSNHEFSITFNDEYCWTPKSTLLGPTPMEVGPYLDVMWSGPQVMEGIQIMKQVPCLVYKYDSAHYHIGGVPVIDPDIMDDPEHPLIIASDLRQMALSLGLPVITDLSALYEFSANNMSIDEVAEMYEDAVYFPKKKGARISTEEYVKGADDIRATQQYENTTNPMGTTPEYDRDTVDTNDYVDEVDIFHPPITPVGVFSRLNTYGVDGFKFDGGNLAFLTKARWLTEAPEKSAEEINKAWNEFGENYTYHEYKDTYDRGGKATIQRICDRSHSWEQNGLNTLMPYALLQGLLGYPYICPDMIGGGVWTATIDASFQCDEELFVRMAQCSALFPMMQFSWAPWRALNVQSQQLCLEAAKIHLKFSDVIMEAVKETQKTGEPILKSMEYCYPHCGYEKINNQFLLGKDMLVCPVIEKGATTRKVVLPAGMWQYCDGEIYEGEQEICVEASISVLPYFIRK